MQRANWIVKWFNVKNGSGFITRSDIREDVFVHQTILNNSHKAKRRVGEGETIEFDVVVGKKGRLAANVTIPESTSVSGSGDSGSISVIAGALSTSDVVM